MKSLSRPRVLSKFLSADKIFQLMLYTMTLVIKRLRKCVSGPIERATNPQHGPPIKLRSKALERRLLIVRTGSRCLKWIQC